MQSYQNRLAFLQETMNYYSMIRNILYSILNPNYRCTASKWVTTISSNLCEIEITHESEIGTGMITGLGIY